MIKLNQKMELWDITGVVTESKLLGQKPKQVNFFHVKSYSSGLTYQIRCPFFCPARKGDIIKGRCVKNGGTGTGLGEFVFVVEPTVEPAANKDAIDNAFLIYMKGKKFTKKLSDKVYLFFRNMALRYINSDQPAEGELKPILQNKDCLDGAIMEMISIFSQKWKENPDIAEPLLDLGLNEDQIKTLFTKWYNGFSIRRLYLLGLNPALIKAAEERGWTLDGLYYQLIDNPYLVEKIPMDLAYKICLKYNRQFGQNMIESADLVRWVDTQTERDKSSCYPLYSLIRKYGRFEELKTTLVEDFGCRIRYNSFYLKHQALIEDILAETLSPAPLKDTTYCSALNKIGLSKEQVEGIEIILNNKSSIIRGKAGSGKTTIIATLCRELDLRGQNYLICAYTGQASGRIKDEVPFPDKVMTLHMALNKTLPPIHTLIIDEISMVPNELLSRVIKKLERNSDPKAILTGKEVKLSRIIMFGDPNQIQPIDPGDLFNQIIESKVVPGKNLVEDHRRIKKGILHANLERLILEPRDQLEFEWDDDCEFIEGGLMQVQDKIRNLIQNDNKWNEITVICPFNEVNIELNKIIMDIFIPPDVPQIRDSFGQVWKVGARVRMKKNRYDIDIMNGDQGIVTKIIHETNSVEILFRYDRKGGEGKRSKKVIFPTFLPPGTPEEEAIEDAKLVAPLSTNLIELGWAISVDKSQGSQWRSVIFYFSEKSGPTGFINWKRFYTAISRAEETLIVIAPHLDRVYSAIRTDPSKRFDNLRKRLRGKEMIDHFVNKANQRFVQMMRN